MITNVRRDIQDKSISGTKIYGGVIDYIDGLIANSISMPKTGTSGSGLIDGSGLKIGSREYIGQINANNSELSSLYIKKEGSNYVARFFETSDGGQYTSYLLTNDATPRRLSACDLRVRSDEYGKYGQLALYRSEPTANSSSLFSVIRYDYNVGGGVQGYYDKDYKLGLEIGARNDRGGWMKIWRGADSGNKVSMFTENLNSSDGNGVVSRWYAGHGSDSLSLRDHYVEVSTASTKGRVITWYDSSRYKGIEILGNVLNVYKDNSSSKIVEIDSSEISAGHQVRVWGTGATSYMKNNGFSAVATSSAASSYIGINDDQTPRFDLESYVNGGTGKINTTWDTMVGGNWCPMLMFVTGTTNAAKIGVNSSNLYSLLQGAGYIELANSTKTYYRVRPKAAGADVQMWSNDSSASHRFHHSYEDSGYKPRYTLYKPDGTASMEWSLKNDNTPWLELKGGTVGIRAEILGGVSTITADKFIGTFEGGITTQHVTFSLGSDETHINAKGVYSGDTGVWLDSNKLYARSMVDGTGNNRHGLMDTWAVNPSGTRYRASIMKANASAGQLELLNGVVSNYKAFMYAGGWGGTSLPGFHLTDVNGDMAANVGVSNGADEFEADSGYMKLRHGDNTLYSVGVKQTAAGGGTEYSESNTDSAVVEAMPFSNHEGQIRFINKWKNIVGTSNVISEDLGTWSAIGNQHHFTVTFGGLINVNPDADRNKLVIRLTDLFSPSSPFKVADHEYVMASKIRIKCVTGATVTFVDAYGFKSGNNLEFEFTLPTYRNSSLCTTTGLINDGSVSIVNAEVYKRVQ